MKKGKKKPGKVIGLIALAAGGVLLIEHFDDIRSAVKEMKNDLDEIKAMGE